MQKVVSSRLTTPYLIKFGILHPIKECYDLVHFKFVPLSFYFTVHKHAIYVSTLRFRSVKDLARLSLQVSSHLY